MFQVTMNKSFGVWSWAVTSPDGASHSGKIKSTLRVAILYPIHFIPDGAKYQVTTNGIVNEPTQKGLW